MIRVLNHFHCLKKGYIDFIYTACSRSLDLLYIQSYFRKLVKTYWIYSSFFSESTQRKSIWNTNLQNVELSQIMFLRNWIKKISNTLTRKIRLKKYKFGGLKFISGSLNKDYLWLCYMYWPSNIFISNSTELIWLINMFCILYYI